MLRVLMMLPLVAAVLFSSGLVPAGILLLLTVAFEIITIIIQRYNRTRLLRVLSRPVARKDAHPDV